MDKYVYGYKTANATILRRVRARKQSTLKKNKRNFPSGLLCMDKKQGRKFKKCKNLFYKAIETFRFCLLVFASQD